MSHIFAFLCVFAFSRNGFVFFGIIRVIRGQVRFL